MMGCTAAVLSEFPALLKELVEGIQAFHDELMSTPRWSRPEIDVQPLRILFRFAGAALILLSALGFATRF